MVRQLTATGAVSGVNITSAGAIGSLSFGSLSGTNILVGVPSTTTFANASSSNVGAGSIGSIRSGSFADSDILTAKITSASLGTVTNSNGGTAFGLAIRSISSFTGVFAGAPAHVGHLQLVNEEVLQAYLAQQAVTFSDYNLKIEG